LIPRRIPPLPSPYINCGKYVRGFVIYLKIK
jgi:hypothetical protein